MVGSMDPSWVTEDLAVEDYPAVRALWERAGLAIRPDGRDSPAQFARQIAGGTQTVIGVRAGTRLIGVVLATHDGRRGWINRLAVDPDFRRQGVGLHLIACAERVLRAQGMLIIAALVEDWNSASLSLLRRAGYVQHPDITYLSKRERPDV